MRERVNSPAIEWKRWLDSYQYIAEIEGVSCQVDVPYDDTVGFRIHVYLSHPGYPTGHMSVSAVGDTQTWEAATYLAEKWARDIARWCSGPTGLPAPGRAPEEETER